MPNYNHQGAVVELLESPKYYIAITALFRDEARFLKEWIEFYKLIGVEHFYLFNHLSTDNYIEVLEPYITEGTVELSNLNYEPKNQAEWYELVQQAAYFNLTKSIQNDVEWLAIVDTDEFLYPIKENSLNEVLKYYDAYASLSVNWRKFGSNNVQRIQENELMIEKLITKDSIPDLTVKSIVKPRYVASFFNPHCAELKPGYKQISENYQAWDGYFSAFSSVVSNNILTINHYYNRDLDFFHDRKLSRVHILSKGLKEDERDEQICKRIEEDKRYSSIYDDKILRFAPALRKQIFKKNSDIKFIPSVENIDLPGDKKIFSLPNDLVFITDNKVEDTPYSLVNGYGVEPYLLRKIISFVNPGEFYVEIGPGYGEFTLQVSQAIGNEGVVHAFEPHHSSYEFFLANRFVNGIENIKLEDTVPKSLDLFFRERGVQNVDILRIDAPNRECDIVDGAQDIINNSENLKLFIKWQSRTGECLTSLSDSGFIFIDVMKFNEECSYLSYQMNYKLSISDILEKSSIEFLAIKDNTFHHYRKFYSERPECSALASQMLVNAAIEGRSEDIENALINRAEVNSYDEVNHRTALYYAAEGNNSVGLRILLDHGADVELGYKDIISPLYLAAYKGYANIVEILLSYNANKEFVSIDRTPIEIAYSRGHSEVVQLLGGVDSYE